MPGMASPLIICVSIHHGNTLKIARVMAEALGAQILTPSRVEPDEISKYGLVGLGSGIYFGKHHKSILRLAENFPHIEDFPAFIFSTSGIPEIPLIHDYHKPLRRILAGKGFKLLGEFSCRGFNTHGPLRFIGGMNRGRPDEGDLEEARRFAENLLTLL